jgi:hypothetical protein
MVDVGMLRKAIIELTDKDGYFVFMAKVEELQNQSKQEFRSRMLKAMF